MGAGFSGTCCAHGDGDDDEARATPPRELFRRGTMGGAMPPPWTVRTRTPDTPGYDPLTPDGGSFTPVQQQRRFSDMTFASSRAMRCRTDFDADGEDDEAKPLARAASDHWLQQTPESSFASSPAWRDSGASPYHSPYHSPRLAGRVGFVEPRETAGGGGCPSRMASIWGGEGGGAGLRRTVSLKKRLDTLNTGLLESGSESGCSSAIESPRGGGDAGSEVAKTSVPANESDGGAAAPLSTTMAANGPQKPRGGLALALAMDADERDDFPGHSAGASKSPRRHRRSRSSRQRADPASAAAAAQVRRRKSTSLSRSQSLTRSPLICDMPVDAELPRAQHGGGGGGGGSGSGDQFYGWSGRLTVT